VHYKSQTNAKICITYPFNGPLSGTTRVSRYQQGKTNLDFTEARDSEWQWHQLGHMQVCTMLQTENHASYPPLSFLQAGCPSCRQTNSVKALMAYHIISYQKFTSRVADISAAVSRRGYRIQRAEICVNMVQNCLKPTTPSRSTRIRTHGWCHSVGNQMVKETKPDRSR